MVHIMRVTRRILSSQLGKAKSGWIACRDCKFCTNFKCSKKVSSQLQLLQAVRVQEKKDDSKQMICSDKLAQYESRIWTFLNATLVMQFLLICPGRKESKIAPRRTRYVHVEYTKYQKVEVTGKLSSPVKTKTSILETLELTVGSFKKVAQSFPGKEACTMCQEVIRKKRFFDERRFGLLRNCDHVVCYGCVRKLCESSGEDNNFSRKFGVALGPVHCPECDVVSDKVAASSKRIVGAEKVEFFKSFNKNFSSDKIISQMTNDFKNLDEGKYDTRKLRNLIDSIF
ncbi:uncharacterized protein TNCT_548101 [Trichonephila clavata]|uniref:RING-type domain-containing protein n=1 Tax=Trichonephila clavata TaxID=2740835 RepID=A0A8X6H1W2_TRICU|nr:uncharacterized protein TNCT_548101 [Trichonephila clavata]